MPIFDKRTAQVISTVLLFVTIGAIAWGARRTLTALLFAIFFAYLLDPVVNLVCRWRMCRNSRGRAILIVYVLLFVIVGGVFSFAGPKLAQEGRSLSERLPSLMSNVSSGQIAHQIGSRRGWSWNTQQRMQRLIASHSAAIDSFVEQLGSHAARLATSIVWFILVPILAVFFLRDGRNFANSLIDLADRRRERQLLRGIFDDFHAMLASYIRAQIVLAALSVVVYTVVLTIIRVPYSLVLGTVGGVMEFVPVLGPLVAAVSIFGVAFLTNYHQLLVLLIFLGAWRLIQDYVNAPRIMGERVELHPLLALFAILVGGEIGGVLGVYLSIPVVAGVRILWKRWERYQKVQQQTSSGPTDPTQLKVA